MLWLPFRPTEASGKDLAGPQAVCLHLLRLNTTSTCFNAFKLDLTVHVHSLLVKDPISWNKISFFSLQLNTSSTRLIIDDNRQIDQYPAKNKFNLLNQTIVVNSSMKFELGRTADIKIHTEPIEAIKVPLSFISKTTYINTLMIMFTH